VSEHLRNHDFGKAERVHVALHNNNHRMAVVRRKDARGWKWSSAGAHLDTIRIPDHSIGDLGSFESRDFPRYGREVSGSGRRFPVGIEFVVHQGGGATDHADLEQGARSDPPRSWTRFGDEFAEGWILDLRGGAITK
jgi:hypothetical protein